MWLIKDLVCLLLAFVLWLALYIPPSLAWNARWHARQLRLKTAPGQELRAREERLLDRVEYGIMLLAAAAAVALALLLHGWWAG